jgi:hypothetical protein
MPVVVGAFVASNVRINRTSCSAVLRAIGASPFDIALSLVELEPKNFVPSYYP